MEFFTIGVYGTTESDYFTKLVDNHIDFFCDIRQRRGVRGSKYTFVNSKSLQQKLFELNIRYLHVSGLAPTSEIRSLQKEADLHQKETKKDRDKLSHIFMLAYKSKVLDKFEMDTFIKDLINNQAKRIILFCVEEKAEACHRSIVANQLEKMGYKITHL
ncbi:DUF488 domain-containing protein [Bacteroides sp. OttesenSCG-928-D19]|nr:DUF488 domain-containing protein [Bacteroides sp. OttesenSCG-928-D19]